jgi:hypothetical protein
MAKTAFNEKNLFTSKMKKKKKKTLVQCYIWSIALYIVATLILRKVHHKYVGRFEVSCN